MTEEERLLAAIVEAPDDDGPRLVYADWLLGRGDLRGELITLQCALARADATDTPLADEAAAVARERELLAACRAPLLHGLPPMAGYLARRGFVEHAAVLPPALFSPIDADGLPRPDLVEGMRAWAPLLRSLTLATTAIGMATPGPAWSALDALTFAEPDDRGESLVRILTSPHVAGVRRVSLINTNDGSARAALAIPQQLEHLTVYGGSTSRAELDGDALAFGIARHAPFAHLRSLHLGRCAFTSAAALHELAVRPIEQLALHACGDAERVLSLIRILPRLHTLELDDEGGGLGKLDLVAVLAAAPQLRRLRVRYHQFDVRLARAFAGSAVGSQLRRLELVHCKLSERTADTLATSKHLRGLARLDMSGTLRSAAAQRRTTRLAWRPLPLYPSVIEDPLVKQGNRIASIKAYREHTTAGLANSKMAVERIWEEIALPPSYVGAVPAWVR